MVFVTLRVIAVLVDYARIRMITYARYRSCGPCPSSVDYGNTKRPSTHSTDIRINVLLYSVFNSRLVSLV